MLEIVLMLNAIRLELQITNLLQIQSNAIGHGTRQNLIDEATRAISALRQEAIMVADQSINLARIKED